MTPQHSAGAGPLTAQDMCEILLPALRPDGRYDFSLQWLTDKLNARLAAAPLIADGFGNQWSKRCPECGELTMTVIGPGKVQCDNPKGCPPVPQDLARLEARLEEHDLCCRMMAYGADEKGHRCGHGWNCERRVQLDAELTLLRAQQATGGGTK